MLKNKEVFEVGIIEHKVVDKNGKVVRTLDASESDFFWQWRV